MIVVRVVCVLALGALLAVAAAGAAERAFPGRNGAIVYVAGAVPGAADVWLAVVAADGGRARRLTPAGSPAELWPAVSPDGRVAFTSTRDGNPDVYVREPDGRMTRLTVDRAADAQPAWSPDGRRIAFASERRGRAEIYVMDADGSDVRRVTTNEGPAFGPGGTTAGDLSPAWSPDGRTLAFSRRSATTSGITLVAPDGTGPQRVTAVGTNVVDASPTWSPDGRSLVFARLIVGGHADESKLFTAFPRAGSPQSSIPGTEGATEPAWSPNGASIAFLRGPELSVLSLVDESVRRLSRAALESSRPAWRPDSRELVFSLVTRTPPYRLRVLDPRGSAPATVPSYGVGQLAEPEWSPEGGRIAYVSAGRLVVAQAHGGGRRLVTRPGVLASSPAWSPDGSWIAFAAAGDLFAVAADGSRLRRISRTPVPEGEPAWSPDGRWIAYAAPAERGGVLELWRVRPDGSGRRRLTDNRVIDQSPAWSPDGRQLAFVSGRTEGRFNPELWVMGAEGGGERRVQPAAAPDGRESWADERPAWSPDGNWLLYTSRGDVWIVHPDGTGSIDLTPDFRSVDYSPSWRPECTRSGRAGPDRLVGTDAAELLCGGWGRDTLVGGPGHDRLFGEPGNDAIDARDGAFDVVGCGPGRDTVRADRIDLVGVDCELVRR